MPLVGYEGAFYRYQTAQTNYQEFLNEVRHYETVNTDWFDILTENAVTQQHSLSISGGSDATRYYASVGYMRQNDVIKTQYVDRYHGHEPHDEVLKELQCQLAHQWQRAEEKPRAVGSGCHGLCLPNDACPAVFQPRWHLLLLSAPRLFRWQQPEEFTSLQL